MLLPRVPSFISSTCRQYSDECLVYLTLCKTRPFLSAKGRDVVLQLAFSFPCAGFQGASHESILFDAGLDPAWSEQRWRSGDMQISITSRG